MRDVIIRVRFRLAALVLLLVGGLAAVPGVAAAQFGVESFTSSFSTAQAGAHADLSTSFALKTEALGNPDGQLRSAAITLPAGLIGNPHAIERCSIEALQGFACGHGSQVGTLGVTLIQCRGISSPLMATAAAGTTTLTLPNAKAFCSEEASGVITVGTGATAEKAKVSSVVNATTLELAAPLAYSHPTGDTVTHIANTSSGSLSLFNVQPTPGQLATFAASLLIADIIVQVHAGDDGRLTATLSETSTVVGLQATTLTLWGVPAAASHNSVRCNELNYECGPTTAAPAPFMTNPTTCAGPSLQTELNITSWQGQTASSTTALPAPSGCDQLAFALPPSMTVTPTSTRRDSPAGYEVDVHVPQTEEPYGLATPEPRKVSITLPPGTSLSPGLANGLQACSQVQFSQANCPDAAKVGTAEVTSPLLTEPLHGAVYIGAPTATEKYRVFARVSAGNAAIALYGQIQTDEDTGQVTAVFDNTPELPIDEFKLNFFGGAGAALANSPVCGPAPTRGTLTAYAGQTASLLSTFNVNEDTSGGACPSSVPFTPSFNAGTDDPVAGSASSFTLTVSRSDGQQALSDFSAHLPPGLAGMLGSVPLCPEAMAAAGTCAQASEIGTATIAAGAGPLPFYLSGPVYLTGPYDGAPFGLVTVIKAIAGPFDLGTVLVRSRVSLDPRTLAITLISDPFPQTLSGIPLRLKTLNVSLTRSGFLLNPTACAPQAVTGTISSLQGAVESVSSPFAVTGCRGLPFAPRLTASTQATNRRATGAGLDLQITYPAGAQANTRSVVVQLPKQLRSRLTTIQQACRAAAFAANPSLCPAGSVVGTGKVSTPILPALLTGPIYLVSHGRDAFPDLAMVLQSQGITVALDGLLQISKKGITTSAFKSVPDVPITAMSLSLPEGPHSALSTRGSLCGHALALPYTITAQSGAQVKHSANVAVRGCRRHDKRPRNGK